MANTGVKRKSTASKKTHRVSLREFAETDITPEERDEMIAETAYYRAMARGFEGNRHLEDWFEAEKIVDEMMIKASTKQIEHV
jgi:hypothetical protein